MNKISNVKLALVSIIIILLCSCKTTKLISELHQEDKESTYFKGFVLYDPQTKKELISFNGSKYFTPASNVKLFTFYTAYRALKDSIVGLEYINVKDSLIIRGTADPSLFYGFDSPKVVNLFKKYSSPIFLVDQQIDEPYLGSGWAWDDYPYYYMPEKSLLPLYGNLVTYKIEGDSTVSTPSYFKKDITVVDTLSKQRNYGSNDFYIQADSERMHYVPFKTSNRLTATLLGKFLKKKVTLLPKSKKYDFKKIYSVSRDSLLKQLLVVSDNFIAEQLMLQVGNEVSNRYSVDSAIQYSLKKYLKDLPQKPRWVDGSGLSRYNLFTPQSQVFLLDKMYQEIPREKLFSYFPVGGRSGTLKNWYSGERPYIYAKSGTLSNNYNLSGYLITKRGHVLLFSSMNNHFKLPLSTIKKDLAELLFKIYETY